MVLDRTALTNKNSIRIVTTDSGLGGLGITANLLARLQKEKQFAEVDCTFFNCKPDTTFGYDNLENNDSRANVFSKALDYMEEAFQPDVILIACNTLSAIFDKTDLAARGSVPVIGIIEDGVNEIYQNLSREKNSCIVMLGTPTTVASGMHKRLLEAKGIAADRLIYQDCGKLPHYIDRDPAGTDAVNCIEESMREAVDNIGDTPFGISLFCTHFGFSYSSFKCAAEKSPLFNGHIINPNSLMVDNFLKLFQSNRMEECNISVEVASQSEHSTQMKQSIIPLLQPIFADTATALEHDNFKPDRFAVGPYRPFHK